MGTRPLAGYIRLVGLTACCQTGPSSAALTSLIVDYPTFLTTYKQTNRPRKGSDKSTYSYSNKVRCGSKRTKLIFPWCFVNTGVHGNSSAKANKTL
jgi:hypothetical protein